MTNISSRRLTSFRAKGPRAPTRLLRSLWRKLRWWGYETRLYDWRLRGRHPLQLLASPDDPLPGRSNIADHMINGTMSTPGGDVTIDPNIWSSANQGGQLSRDHLVRFRWLTDLSAASDQSSACALAEDLMTRFLNQPEAVSARHWPPVEAAERIINWLVHAPIILSSSDMVYRSKLLLSLARQTRHLARTWQDAAPGVDQITAATALTMSGLLLPGGQSWLYRGQRALDTLSRDVIQSDGGPASRNPADALAIMRLMILARAAFLDREEVPPATIQRTLDRLAPFIRAMRHPDGGLAHMAGATAKDGNTADALLAASDARGKALENAPRTGYQRISLGRGVLIADSGPPPAPLYSGHAAASTGSFEFSSGRHRLIVNMGRASAEGQLKGLDKLSRNSAAHSTLIIDNRNSSRVDPATGLVARGVSEVTVERQDVEGGSRLKISHDGYVARYGVRHMRSLTLSASGLLLEGEDKLAGSPKKRLSGAPVHLCFHTGPDCLVTLAHDDMPVIETPTGDVWRFDVNVGSVSLEDSLFLPSMTDIRPSRQILVQLTSAEALGAGVAWRFTRQT